VRTLLVTATALITTLGKALAESKLKERLKLLSQPQLLIIDEIGYLPTTGREPICSFNWCRAAVNVARPPAVWRTSLWGRIYLSQLSKFWGPSQTAVILLGRNLTSG
jgi:IstB-like ATP binding protein